MDKDVEQKVLESGEEAAHFQTLSKLLEDLYVPKIGCGFDRAISRSDFIDYIRNDSLFTNILEFVDVNFNAFNSSDKSQKYLKDVLSPLIIVCGQHSSENPWTSESSRKKSPILFKKLCHLFGYSSISDMLTKNSCFLFKDVLHKMRPWLLKESWKNYPAAAISFRWALEHVKGNQMFTEPADCRVVVQDYEKLYTECYIYYSVILIIFLKSPHLSDHLNIVLPTALIITDDFDCGNRMVGLYCLGHIVKEVGMTHLSWYSQDQVILKAIEPFFYYKEEKLISPLISLFVALLNKKHPLRARPTFHVNEFDELIDRFLQNMLLEQRLDLRSGYIASLPDVIHARGLGMVLHSTHLVSIITEYVLEPTSSLEALKVLQAYIDVCWPRIQTHCTSFLIILCRTCLGLKRKRFPGRCQNLLMTILHQLQKLCPEKVNPFFCRIGNNTNLSQLTSMLAS